MLLAQINECYLSHEKMDKILKHKDIIVKQIKQNAIVIGIKTEEAMEYIKEYFKENMYHIVTEEILRRKSKIPISLFGVLLV